MAHFRFIKSEKFKIDIPQALSAIERLEWYPYTEKRQHWGIGLTCNQDSLSPNTEALQIKQDLTPDPISQGQELFQKFDSYSPAADGYFKEFFSGFKVRTSKAKLSRLEPGAIIPPHKDLGCEGIIRIHWVLSCEEENYFLFYNDGRRREPLKLSPGDVFAFDPNVIHGVQYKATGAPRIHLVANYSTSLESLEEYLV